MVNDLTYDSAGLFKEVENVKPPVRDAIYIKPEMEDYIGNPFIEALPRVYEEDEVVKLLSNYPVVNQSELDLSARHRAFRIRRILRYFQPFPIHLKMELHIGMTIREGYLARNPITAGYIKRLNLGAEAAAKDDLEYFKKYVSYISSGSTAIGFTVIGLSGVGKTTTIKQILSLYPQIIRHTNYRGIPMVQLQITWLKIDCTHDVSLRGLCMSFFAEIDRILGTKYEARYTTERITVDGALPRMAHLATLYGIGILVVDEIQYLSKSKSGGGERILNFFTTLVNTVNVPIIFVGTGKAKTVLQNAFRLARRGCGLRDFLWDRLEKDDVWDLAIKSMWKYQWLKHQTPLTDEMSEALYDESQGIMDIAVKVYALSQIKAVSSGEEKLTVKIIRSVAKECLQLVKPMIDALREKDLKKLALYDDIEPLNVEIFVKRYTEQIEDLSKLEGFLNVTHSQEEIQVEEIITNLITMGISTSKAQSAARTVFKKYSNTKSSVELLAKAFAVANGINTEDRKGDIKKINNSDLDENYNEKITDSDIVRETNEI